MIIFMTIGHFQFYNMFGISNSNLNKCLSATQRSSKELILASKPNSFVKILTIDLALGFYFNSQEFTESRFSQEFEDSNFMFSN